MRYHPSFDEPRIHVFLSFRPQSLKVGGLRSKQKRCRCRGRTGTGDALVVSNFFCLFQSCSCFFALWDASFLREFVMSWIVCMPIHFRSWEKNCSQLTRRWIFNARTRQLLLRELATEACRRKLADLLQLRVEQNKTQMKPWALHACIQSLPKIEHRRSHHLFSLQGTTIQMKSRLPIRNSRGAQKIRSFLQNISRLPFSTHSRRQQHSRSSSRTFHGTLCRKHHVAPTNTSLPASKIDGHSVATTLRSAINELSVRLCDASERGNHIADAASRDVNAVDWYASIQTQGMQKGVATYVQRECS